MLVRTSFNVTSNIMKYTLNKVRESIINRKPNNLINKYNSNNSNNSNNDEYSNDDEYSSIEYSDNIKYLNISNNNNVKNNKKLRKIQRYMKYCILNMTDTHNKIEAIIKENTLLKLENNKFRNDYYQFMRNVEHTLLFFSLLTLVVILSYIKLY